jgi:(S)-2-hydroxyglutarate dehydrogenase
MPRQLDVVVVGGGALGLAVARRLALDGRRVVVLEKEPELARHQTGRNSGVIHSGVYYAPGSLKARLCAAGKESLLRYADERGIPHELCGKLIVALDERELPRLRELERRATANGVESIRDVPAGEIQDVEPSAVGLRALHVPRTGIIDYTAVAHAYADDILLSGNEIRVGRTAEAIRVRSRTIEIDAGDETFVAEGAIACAGLQSDRILELAGGGPAPVRIVPFRGDYYTFLAGRGPLIRGLVYPVPDPRFPFLGVHLTRMIDGSLTAGPNAVLALAREGYGRASFDVRDAIDVLRYRGFWRLARRHVLSGAQEVWRDLSKRAFVADLQRYVPSVRGEDVAFGPSGIRAQAVTPDGRLADDFVLEKSERMMHVLNAPSPGATASLAIAGELVRRFDA